MLSFLLLVICDSFDLLAFRLADQAWILLQIGLVMAHKPGLFSGEDYSGVDESQAECCGG